MDPLDLIDSDNFRTYNISIARICGVNAAIMLSELVQRYKYHKKNNELIETHKKPGQWFYYTHDKAEERTALTRKEQDSAIAKLESLNLIKKIVLGVPPKRYFQINIETLYEMLGFSKKEYNMSKRDKSKCPKGTNLNVQKGQNIYREENDKEHQEEKYEQRITKEKPIEGKIVDRDSSFDPRSNSFSSEEKELSDKIDRLGNLKFLDNTPINKNTVMRWLLKYSFDDIDAALKYYFKAAKLGKNKIKKHEAYLENILKYRYWEIQVTKNYVEENIREHEKRKQEDREYWEKQKRGSYE